MLLPRPKASMEPRASRAACPLRPARLVLPVCHQPGHPANMIKRLVSLGRHQSFDHEFLAAPFEGTYLPGWPGGIVAAHHRRRGLGLLGLLGLRWSSRFLRAVCTGEGWPGEGRGDDGEG